MTKIMSWDIRGLNTSARQREVGRVLTSLKPSICILVETKIKHHKKDKIMRKSFKGWSCIDNYEFHEKGRIWVLYREDDIKVNVCHKSKQMISCIVDLNGYKFQCSAIYAMNSSEERKKLWADLEQLRNNLPWLALGDFNCISFPHEKIGGDIPNEEAMEDFNRCLHEVELEDLKWWGQKYTWWNKQEGVDKIECKLDRVLTNSDWYAIFPWSDTNFLLLGVSDHSPSVVDTGNRKDMRPKPFRFFYMWTHHEDFLEVVNKAWEIPVQGDPLFRVVQKLKSVKKSLKIWNMETFGRIDKKIEALCT